MWVGLIIKFLNNCLNIGYAWILFGLIMTIASIYGFNIYVTMAIGFACGYMLVIHVMQLKEYLVKTNQRKKLYVIRKIIVQNLTMPKNFHRNGGHFSSETQSVVSSSHLEVGEEDEKRI